MIYLILILALILRLIVINQSYWLDEAIQVLESTAPFFKVWQIPADFHPPLFHYLAHFWLKPTTVEWWARLLPVFLGMTTIWLLFLMAKEFFGQKTAILASLFLATSPFHIFYSQELRPYALSAFASTTSYYFFLKILKSKKRLHWLFIFSNIVGLYSFYFFPFIFIAQLLVIILFYQKKIIIWLTNCCLSILSFLPWLPMLFKQLSIGSQWATNFPIWRTSVASPLLKALPLSFTKFWLGNTSFENKLLYSFFIFLLLIFTLFLTLMAWRKKRKKTYLVLIFFALPILTSFLISVALPIIAPKRLLLVAPQFFLLLALGVTSLPKNWQKVAIGTIIVINIFSLGRYYLDPRFQREQWRQAVAWVEKKAIPGKGLVLFEFLTPLGPWDYYQNNKVEAKAVFKSGLSVGQIMPQLVGDKEQIFLFQYLYEMTDPNQLVSQWLKNNGFSLEKTVDFPGVGFVYEYQKNY